MIHEQTRVGTLTYLHIFPELNRIKEDQVDGQRMMAFNLKVWTINQSVSVRGTDWDTESGLEYHHAETDKYS